MQSEGFYVNEKSTYTSWDRTSELPICSTAAVIRWSLLTCHVSTEGSIVIALVFVKLIARCGWVVSAKSWPLYPQERDQVSILDEARRAPGILWTGVENRISLVPTRVQTPDCSVHSELLCPLRYPGPL